jgi:hypothetical protein
VLLGFDLLQGAHEVEFSVQQAIDRLHELPLQWSGLPGPTGVVGTVRLLQLSEHVVQTPGDALYVLHPLWKRSRLASLLHADHTIETRRVRA